MNNHFLLGLATAVIFPALSCNAQTYTILHSFKDGKDGSSPLPGSGAGYLEDAAGNLYGAAAFGGDLNCGGGSGCGVEFELSPPAKGSTNWTDSVLYRFKGGTDGEFPGSTLLPDGNGGYYGNTFEGGTGSCAPLGTVAGCGTAFHLTPSAGGSSHWKETVLYRFQSGTDGSGPTGPFVSDKNGSLYSMTYAGGAGTCSITGGGCGTVYRLDPPAKGSKSWTETILYAFSGGADGAVPEAGLTMDSAGNLFGVTGFGGNLNCFGGLGCGVVFELSPPANGKTTWTETVLYTFSGGSDGASPQPPPIFDSAGDLLGTASSGGNSGYGTFYQLSPPPKGQSAWTFTVLYALGGPPDGAYLNSPLVPDNSGNYVTGTFYGGTGSCAFTNEPLGCGTVLKLSPPTKKGGSWTESVLYSIPAQSKGALVGAPLIVDASGVIYGATFTGGNPKYCGGSGCGVSFSLKP